MASRIPPGKPPSERPGRQNNHHDPDQMVNLFDWLEQVGVRVPEEHRAEVAAEFAEIAREMGHEPPAGGPT
jgi:hypothetical protein